MPGLSICAAAPPSPPCRPASSATQSSFSIPRVTCPPVHPARSRTVADASTATGLRVAVPLPVGPTDLQEIFGGLLPETNALDGFSPLAHFVVELSDAPDATTLPQSPAESLDPFATVGLFDVTPDSPTYGQRIPFRLQPRTDTSVAGVVAHTLLIFPSIPLTPERRYGLIVTRRLLVDPTRPFDPSDAFRAARDEIDGGLLSVRPDRRPRHRGDAGV